ncbi:MAG: hypothetical protein AAF827_08370 [Cyanobacteria bacterium P01_D01_bin.6]
MGYIATYFVQRIANIATEGLDDKAAGYAELCQVAGIDSSSQLTQKKMFTDVAFFQLLEYVVNKFELGYTMRSRFMDQDYWK